MEHSENSISLNLKIPGEKKIDSLINKVIYLQLLFSITFIILVFFLNIFSRVNNDFPWSNLFLFFIHLIVAVINPFFSLALLTCVIPFTANLSEQVKALFHLEFFTLDLLSIDASIGFLAGILFLSLWRRNWKFRPEKLTEKTRVLVLLLLSFHVLIVITVAIAISRNLYQAASPYSTKGFFYNLTNLRYISQFDDYFPLRDLFIFTTVITLSISLLSLVRTKSQLRRNVLCPLLVATVIILSYALVSKLTGIGYNRDDIVSLGVNSFFPDLHAYGGYAVAAFMGGLYYLTSSKTLGKIAAGAFSLLAVVGVVVSGSRFSIAMLFVTSLIYISFFIIKNPKKHLLVFVFIALLAIAASVSLSYWGSRGLFQDLAQVPKADSFEKFSLVLSDRPEIFRSTLLMYSHYPILGLGKGLFNRENSILEFSKSPFFEAYPGENAHNYFLQVLADTGIVGLSLFCAIFIYQALYLRNQHNQIITVLILGIFSGNLYGHSLLLPNLLVLLFILLGASNTEVQENSIPVKLFPINFPKPWRYSLIAAATVLAIAAMIEVKTSYGKIPFQQQFVCYKPAYYGDNDGHTSGLFKSTYAVDGNSLDIEYTVYHPDTQRRPLTIDFDLEQQGQKIATHERTLKSSGQYKEKFDISKLTTGSEISLRIKTSRCLTPINLGLNLDKRRLGIQLNDVSQHKTVI